MGRCCRNCYAYEKNGEDGKSGLCEVLGRGPDLRMCYQDREHVKLKPKVTGYMVCDLHMFPEENQSLLRKDLQDNPEKYEPKQ
jgi:hypothetical protein